MTKKEIYKRLCMKFPAVFLEYQKNQFGQYRDDVMYFARGVQENTHVRRITPEERAIIEYLFGLFEGTEKHGKTTSK